MNLRLKHKIHQSDSIILTRNSTLEDAIRKYDNKLITPSPGIKLHELILTNHYLERGCNNCLNVIDLLLRQRLCEDMSPSPCDKCVINVEVNKHIMIKLQEVIE